MSAADNPDYGRSVLLRRTMFNEGYGGSLPDGTKAGMGSLTLRRTQERYGCVSPYAGGHTLVVSGALSSSDVRVALKQAFRKTAERVAALGRPTFLSRSSEQVGVSACKEATPFAATKEELTKSSPVIHMVGYELSLIHI